MAQSILRVHTIDSRVVPSAKKKNIYLPPLLKQTEQRPPPFNPPLSPWPSGPIVTANSQFFKHFVSFHEMKSGSTAGLHSHLKIPKILPCNISKIVILY